eukprot:2684025-Pyramimonas_sp.AAC.1
MQLLPSKCEEGQHSTTLPIGSKAAATDHHQDRGRSYLCTATQHAPHIASNTRAESKDSIAEHAGQLLW